MSSSTTKTWWPACEGCAAPLPPGVQRNRRFCGACKKERRLSGQRRIRAATGNAHTKAYEKTPKGFLMRAYRNMESRVAGVQKKGSWTGKPILPREDFYDWALSDPEFWRLFEAYTDADYEMRLAPSVNRIDTDRGYELDNIEWITHSLNSSLAARRG